MLLLYEELQLSVISYLGLSNAEPQLPKEANLLLPRTPLISRARVWYTCHLPSHI